MQTVRWLWDCVVASVRDATCPRRELDERKGWWSNTWSRTQCLTGLNETNTMFAGLELKLVVRVVWEKNTVGWLVVRSWCWNSMRRKYCWTEGCWSGSERQAWWSMDWIKCLGISYVWCVPGQCLGQLFQLISLPVFFECWTHLLFNSFLVGLASSSQVRRCLRFSHGSVWI